MKMLRSLVSALLVLAGFSGCLQEEKVIKVKPDGSGTIEERFVLSKEAAGQMKMMGSGLAGALGGGKEPTKPFEILDEKKLRADAEKMGDGVTFVSATPTSSAAGEGYVAIYAFADISKLKIDQNPGSSLPGADNPMLNGGKKQKVEAVKFEFTKGSPAQLTIKFPQPKPEDFPKDRPQVPEGSVDMAMVMMQQMFKDMKIGLAVEVAGKIVNTNAAYREGSRVTLMELDFNKVLANPEKFKALAKAQPKTMEETKTLVKDIDGIKAESQPQVVVKFQ